MKYYTILLFQKCSSMYVMKYNFLELIQFRIVFLLFIAILPHVKFIILLMRYDHFDHYIVTNNFTTNFFIYNILL